jgi:hypothetical protein
MPWLAGLLVGPRMPLVGNRGPPRKAATFLRQARAEEGLQLRGPGYTCCLSSQLSGDQGTRRRPRTSGAGYKSPWSACMGPPRKGSTEGGHWDPGGELRGWLYSP